MKDKPYNAMLTIFGYEDDAGVFTAVETFLVVKDDSKAGESMDALYESLKSTGKYDA